MASSQTKFTTGITKMRSPTKRPPTRMENSLIHAVESLTRRAMEGGKSVAETREATLGGKPSEDGARSKLNGLHVVWTSGIANAHSSTNVVPAQSC